jgi:hypothetical protein
MKQFIDDASSSINPTSAYWPLAKRISQPRLTLPGTSSR